MDYFSNIIQRPFNGKTNDELSDAITKDELEIPTDIRVSDECIQVLNGVNNN